MAELPTENSCTNVPAEGTPSPGADNLRNPSSPLNGGGEADSAHAEEMLRLIDWLDNRELQLTTLLQTRQESMRVRHQQQVEELLLSHKRQMDAQIHEFELKTEFLIEKERLVQEKDALKATAVLRRIKLESKEKEFSELVSEEGFLRELMETAEKASLTAKQSRTSSLRETD